MEFIKENKFYLIICLGFSALGMASILFGLFYSSIYSGIVLDIVEDLNNGAPIETYQFLMQALSNGAEIEPMSEFFRISVSVMGVFFLYLSFYIWINKENEDGFGVFFTRKYWFTFFLFRKKKVTLSESAQKAIDNTELLLKQRKRNHFEDIANNKANLSEKKEAIKALTRKT